jgi:GNAT superfamily N-acetyltransferase
MNVAISDLRQQPGFFDTVADRIWRAWWRDRGYAREYIIGRLHKSMNTNPIPFALAAHADATFLGTTSVIVSGLEDLPHYTPWVAAVWVDSEFRQRQIGRALVARAAGDAFNLGISAFIFARQSYAVASTPGRVGY